MTNEAYTGRTYFNKSVRTGKTTRRLRPREDWQPIIVPAIIDQGTFDAAQRQLDRNREVSPRNKIRDYLLSGGHLRCGRCGRGMTGGAYGSTRRYRCSSMNHIMDRDSRCYGQLKADDVEPQVWAAVVRLLEQPELIALEVQRQEHTADEQRAEVQRELTLIEAGLTKCEREQQKWEQAYVNDAIDLTDFKGKKAEVEARRQGLLRQRAEADAKLESIGQAVERVEALTDYCRRLRQRLQTFEYAEKRRALQALGICVTWIPGQDLVIDCTITLKETVPMAS